jgi:hypothetical protein
MIRSCFDVLVAIRVTSNFEEGVETSSFRITIPELSGQVHWVLYGQASRAISTG